MKLKCRNKIHDMGKGENKKRRILREEFINNHIILCKTVFTGENNKEKSTEARVLIALARIELNYSPKTVSVDIYSRLINTFNEM